MDTMNNQPPMTFLFNFLFGSFPKLTDYMYGFPFFSKQSRDMDYVCSYTSSWCWRIFTANDQVLHTRFASFPPLDNRVRNFLVAFESILRKVTARFWLWTGTVEVKLE